MTEQGQEPGKEKKLTHYCDVCKTKYGHDQAKIQQWACCGYKLSEIEILYRSDPSPTGP